MISCLSSRNECSVSELTREAKNVTVHGNFIKLCPLRISKRNRDIRYFDGKLSDGVKVAHVVSFEPLLHAEASKIKESGTAVSLVNCSTKTSGKKDMVTVSMSSI